MDLLRQCTQRANGEKTPCSCMNRVMDMPELTSESIAERRLSLLYAAAEQQSSSRRELTLVACRGHSAVLPAA